ncbi:biotin--[acetyl-CoA-carboxylase] ligase [Glutamicibacter sp. JL.03c]|uniref:biotin--[acetyl-CoA-carboxylase] ligase n=1 Tax=Glutamicibacter sp. JL.03c TaxID=2984842 RepID=UPI0021F7F564|nr:biotin--[acetyl-CoA-carboxylase] ligase [Glutamicibacter sp. JL.03c]UYQ78346.1 biotin--[acetyl-CoA-carboxylase] ligase [Glutamicibacter sp. JL.03c]
MNTSDGTARAAIDPARFAQLTQRLELGAVLFKSSSGSTNTELAELAAAGTAGHLSVYYTEHQQAGKGRLGRSWVTPLGSSITVSVLMVPGASFPTEALSWYTMLAALAWSRAAERVAEVPVRIKWPNDLLAGGFKICGILAQMVPAGSGHGVVVGTGMNVDQSREELPVPTATSLRLASSRAIDRTELLAEYLKELVDLDRAFRQVSGSAQVPLPGFEGRSLQELVSEKLATLGHIVRVEFPDGKSLEATAVQLAADGALVLEESSGRRTHVLAGDVHHVRRADGKYA